MRNRLPPRFESRRPKELPLEALTEPDVNVSAHPALVFGITFCQWANSPGCLHALVSPAFAYFRLIWVSQRALQGAACRFQRLLKLPHRLSTPAPPLFTFTTLYAAHTYRLVIENDFVWFKKVLLLPVAFPCQDG